MNEMTKPQADAKTVAMQDILARQKAANIREGAPSAEKRIERLDRCIALLKNHSQEIVDALNNDFGNRSKDQSLLTDVVSSILPLKHAKAHVRKWMKPEKRKTEFPMSLLGGKSEVLFQPKGVVGVISPWNFPVQLTFAPLSGIIAAGNRAMIKPSEFTPETSALMERLFKLSFEEDEIHVVTGGPEVGSAFASLPFDHLLFTGATSIAYHVMRAAAENLVPLTLELGGKSPVVIGPNADLEKTAMRIMAGKTMNAGQICLAPDYVLAPKDKADAFVKAAEGAVAKLYPTIKDNPDYTSVINQRHYDRIKGLVDDAKAKGATVKEINPANEDFSQQEHRRIPPTVILNPTDDMKVMQEEIFGPILPVKTYDKLDDAVAYVNAHPRPLGLYYFGEEADADRVIAKTTSGGVTVNDVIFHIAQEDLPFGGVGPAGMGSYHGHDGFLEFSHKKAVYKQTHSELIALSRPPYGEKFRGYLKQQMK